MDKTLSGELPCTETGLVFVVVVVFYFILFCFILCLFLFCYCCCCFPDIYPSRFIKLLFHACKCFYTTLDRTRQLSIYRARSTH